MYLCPLAPPTPKFGGARAHPDYMAPVPMLHGLTNLLVEVIMGKVHSLESTFYLRYSYTVRL